MVADSSQPERPETNSIIANVHRRQRGSSSARIVSGRLHLHSVPPHPLERTRMGTLPTPTTGASTGRAICIGNRDNFAGLLAKTWRMNVEARHAKN